jgi:hypothetical protein
MKVIDNALSKLVFGKLQSHITSWMFPWYWGRRVDDSDMDNLFLYGWSHGLFDNGQPTDKEWANLETAVLAALDSTGQKIKAIHRVRLVLNTTADDNYVNGPHVDFQNPHYTALLYINDADGPTEIYNEVYDPLSGLDAREHYEILKDKLTLLSSVEPKENRLVYFNGLHYHSGTTPKVTARRIVLNINYSVEE